MDYLFNFIYTLPPKSATIIAVLLGFILIDDLPAEKQNVLGNFLVLVGQVVATNAAQQDYSDGLKPDKEKEQMKNDIERLKKQIEELRR
ncbi:MAG: hypothetical protein PHD78_00535 [Bacilli bacterium]|nr:hypothetical protein [Bacilli bacterium]MDD4053890.1 hypothetical protein [Bacilli bacterium]MDD4411259.1 hypothetical protein [Bacilli bacterium]